MDKDIKDFLDWLEDEDSDSNIWELESLLGNKHDQKMLNKIFNNEQLVLIKRIVKDVVWALDEWHNKKDEESHADIRQKINKLEARFRNHRHETTKKFSGKAEY